MANREVSDTTSGSSAERTSSGFERTSSAFGANTNGFGLTASDVDRPSGAAAVLTDRPEQGDELGERNQVESTKELSLTGERPQDNLNIIKELNNKSATAMPREFASSEFTLIDGADQQLSATGDTPTANQEEQHDVARGDKRTGKPFDQSALAATTRDTTLDRSLERTKVGNTEFSVTRDADGKPTEFTDRSGTWRAQNDGETFVNTGDKDQPRFMRGTPTIDVEGNFSFKNSDFGTTQTHFRNGNSRTEIESSDGQRVSLERNSSGIATQFEDRTGTWTSSDGKNWRNETGATRSGSPSIDANGEYTFRDRTGKVTEKTESKELSEAKKLQQDISRKYGVEISQPGERLEEGATVQPAARELRALDDTFDRSKQMDMLSGKDGDKDRKPLKISFFGPDAKGTHGEGFGVYSDDALGIFQNSRINPEGWLGLKGVGLHELVHHEQSKMSSDDWRGKNPGPEIEHLREAFGWKYHQKFGPVMLDKNGGMWSPTSRGNHDHEGGPSTSWVWVDGTKLQKGEKHTINGSEMAERAKVKQASEYNSSPYESHAEAASLLRHDPADLARRAPEVYKAVRDWDQTKINKVFGEGKMIRGINGKIVQDNAENRQARQEMERRFGI